MNKVWNEVNKHTAYPTTITAKAFVESSFRVGIAGDLDGSDKANSLGVLQIQVSTVRWLATIYLDLAKVVDSKSDYDIAMKLLKDINFSTWVACLHFEHYRKRWGYFKAISIYNGGTNNKEYFERVEKAKQKVIEWRKKK